MHNYANLCIIMHATYTILLSSLPGIMTKVCVKFHLDPMNGFWEKVERTDVRTNEENYNIDNKDVTDVSNLKLHEDLSHT